MTSSWIYVFLGGGLGSVVRYLFSVWLQVPLNKFPIPTFVANMVACFILGILLTMQVQGKVSNTAALLLMTGFCGGFSTYSTFSAETIRLLQNGEVISAVWYISCSLIFGILSVYLGMKSYAYF